MSIQKKLIWTAITVLGAVSLSDRRSYPWRARQCRMARRRGGVCPPHRVPFLWSFHRQQGARRERCAADAGLSSQRRSRLRADQSLRALRASFRSHSRRRPAGRTGARGTDGLSARHAVDSRRRSICRRGAGHDRAVPIDSPRRPISWGHDPLGDGPLRGNHRRHRRLAHLHHCAGCPGAGRGQRAEGQCMGHLHRVLYTADRPHHGRSTAASCARAASPRCRSSARCCSWRR